MQLLRFRVRLLTPHRKRPQLSNGSAAEQHAIGQIGDGTQCDEDEQSEDGWQAVWKHLPAQGNSAIHDGCTKRGIANGDDDLQHRNPEDTTYARDHMAEEDGVGAEPSDAGTNDPPATANSDRKRQ